MKIIQIEDDSYPDCLKKIKNPPKKLYALGEEKLLKGDNIAIIGSRNCTEYGEKQAKKFAKALSYGGFNIVSGLAVGIDGIAHKACLEACGKTIAVIGSGFNYIYPQENEGLFYKILEEGGLIITEYEPNTKVESRHFPARNRIVSGISSGVLVIEAAHRSGTSITAEFAKTQGRDVYCIPSSLDSNKGVGTARLITKGAKLVLKPEDILENYKLKKREQKEIEKLVQVEIPDEYNQVYKLIGNGDYINNIAKKAKLPVQEISQKLFMMELEGYIEKRYGDFYVPKA